MKNESSAEVNSDNNDPSCFIAMPISTPNVYFESGRYKEKDHFKLVLYYIFKKAVEKAGYRPLLPVSEKPENIPASIVKKIVEADMMLVDISTKNPNVFLELGLRTAQNRPVIIVSDNKNEDIPFDISTINTHFYNPSLRPDDIQASIDQISEYIKGANQMKENPFWKSYGLDLSIPSLNRENSDPSQLVEEQIRRELKRLSAQQERIIDKIDGKNRNDIDHSLDFSQLSLLADESDDEIGFNSELHMLLTTIYEVRPENSRKFIKSLIRIESLGLARQIQFNDGRSDDVLIEVINEEVENKIHSLIKHFGIPKGIVDTVVFR